MFDYIPTTACAVTVTTLNISTIVVGSTYLANVFQTNIWHRSNRRTHETICALILRFTPHSKKLLGNTLKFARFIKVICLFKEYAYLK